jgi:hypothetical protein
MSCDRYDSVLFEDQLDEKRRKVEYMGIRYNCTGPGKNKGKNNNPYKIHKIFFLWNDSGKT